MIPINNIKVIQPYPNGPELGTILTSSQHGYSSKNYNQRVSHQEYKRFPHYFEVQPLNYEVLELDDLNRIVSVKRLNDDAIFNAGDFVTHKVNVKRGFKDTWELAYFNVNYSTLIAISLKDDKPIDLFGLGGLVK